MLKRPLLCGVLAFVIGQIIISRGNMTWGLGMIPIGFVIWCIRKRNQSGIMPFFVVALSYLSAARRIERNAVSYVVAVAKIYGCLL